MRSKPLSVDFLAPKFLHRLRTSTLRDPLLRAVGIKKDIPLTLIDTTAGFGQDACLLAYHGATVIMIERDKEMGELLQQGLLNVQHEGELTEVTKRMSLVRMDAKSYLQDLNKTDYPDVIYLDPMFLHRKKSALPNKNMQFLQSRVDDSDADQLLSIALSHAKKRVVVKRELNAPYLGDIKPSMSIKSKLVRFDIFLVK